MQRFRFSMDNTHVETSPKSTSGQWLILDTMHHGKLKVQVATHIIICDFSPSLDTLKISNCLQIKIPKHLTSFSSPLRNLFEVSTHSFSSEYRQCRPMWPDGFIPIECQWGQVTLTLDDLSGIIDTMIWIVDQISQSYER